MKINFCHNVKKNGGHLASKRLNFKAKSAHPIPSPILRSHPARALLMYDVAT